MPRPSHLLACTTLVALSGAARITHAGNGLPAGLLDPDAATPPAELAVASGRATRIPVSYYFKTSAYRTNAHTFGVRAVCSRGDAAIVLRARDAAGIVVGTWLADDQTWSLDPQLYGPARPTLTFYDLYVFSKQRGTSLCTVSITAPTGGTWVSLGTYEVGGTLVEVGPMPAGDFVEVRTPDNGLSRQTDTDLLVFDVPVTCHAQNASTCVSSRPSVGAFGTTTDQDPRVVADAAWTTTRNLALIGRSQRVMAGDKAETRVDVVHGPLDADASATVEFPPAGGASEVAYLTPGRHYVWLWAGTDTPTGDTSVVLNAPPHHLHCPTQGRPEDARGQLNDHAFTVYVERLVFNPWVYYWTTIDSRRVPLGALGTDRDATAVMSRIVLEVEETQGSFVRLRTEPGPGDVGRISYADRWGHVRNPDTTELKVASLNMRYRDLQTRHEYTNAANLLTGRVAFTPGSERVVEEIDRSPYEWEADVVSLQEGRGDPYADFDAFDVEASRGAAAWTHLIGMTENQFGWDGFGGTFVSAAAWPGGDAGTAWWPRGAARPNLCSGSVGGASSTHDSHIRCLLDEDAGGDWDNYTIPARASARRIAAGGAGAAGNDRPVGVFTIHLDSESSSARQAEIVELADLMAEFVEKPGGLPAAFNRAGTPNALAPGNRFIVLGDANTYSHDCGENYALLRALRARFGYAVDVSLAVDESFSIGSGMHNYSATVGLDRFPVPYVSRDVWAAMANSDPAKWEWFVDPQPGEAAFPWFARTYGGETAGPGASGDRFDVIYLVGLGWAGDDPVREYTVMQRATACNPYSVIVNGVCGAVETYHVNSGVGGVPNGFPHYRPRRRATDGATATGGEPALMTDHVPIGVRLRVFTEDDLGGP